ncbi:TrlF family AAA-like ATPase [Verrucomicrobiota bacterium sgz303538]
MSEKGSSWWKWDLHVHTPASLHHHYGGSGDVWEAFITAVEALPPEIKVIGINDYIFVDGYKRVKQEHAAGRLKNIELFLPVVELRLDKFGGSKSNISRVNFHVIFAESVAPETIESQFLSRLCSKYIMTPARSSLISSGRWTGVPTRESLADLGQTIIDSVPPEKRADYDIPIKEGFNNLCCSLADIQEALNSPYFEGKFLTAVGKTEWADLKWTEQSIAEKKTIINSADLVFISSDTVPNCVKSRTSLTLASVNDRLLDCSDAHYFADSKEKDRLAKCFTWIRAEPTFEGLRQAVFEYKSRVEISESRPLEPLLQIKEVNLDFPENTKLQRDGGSDDFCLRGKRSLHFSPFITCVIGGRGSGKSTLLSIINERLHPGSTSFFKTNRLSPATISLQSTVTIEGIAEPGIVEFLQQNEIEQFATDYKRLTAAILERLKKLDTGGKLAESEDKIALAEASAKEQIARIEENHRLTNRITAGEQELLTQKSLVDSFSNESYRQMNEDLSALNKELRTLRASKSRLDSLLLGLEGVLHDRHARNTSESRNAYDTAATQLVADITAVVQKTKAIPELQAAETRDAELSQKILERRAELDKFLKDRGLSAENLADVGRATERIAVLEEELATAREKVAEIREKIAEFTSPKQAAVDYGTTVNELLAPINEVLKSLSTEVKAIELRYEFDANQCRKWLVQKLTDILGEQGRTRFDHVNSMLEDVDCLALTTLDAVLVAIPEDKATGRALRDHLKEGVRFEVLKLEAELAMLNVGLHGRIHVFYDGRPIENSSFGQRCTAAIVVLLLLGNTPIVIDEPEAHLDSALIARYLVELIKQRKQHRQIIFATHNANFVVNGDAELIHCLSMDGERKTKVTSTTIENLNNRDLLLALEGGKEAFEKRERRYGVLASAR